MTTSSRIIAVLVLAAAALAFAVPDEAWARAGGGRSMGSAGSRSLSMPRTYSPPAAPARPSTSPSAQPYASPTPAPQASPFGGLWRGLAGGMLGGFVGSLLFGGLAHGAGWGGGFGGGFGLLEILLLVGLGYAVYAMFRRSRATEAPATGYYAASAAGPYAEGAAATVEAPAPRADVEQGIRHIQQMDASFDPAAFTDWATDAFFQIQAAWMRRDVETLRPLLTEEMQREFRAFIDEARASGRVNKLENITVRSVEPIEAWQEQGQDYVTVRYLANLLDYTVDERSGRVVQGSETTPVKFEEFWTWARPVGPHPWKLSAIQQAG